MTSVIIPAHNEENVILNALRSLKESSLPADEIIVVCNGCTDNTAKLVRKFSEQVVLIETPIPSKIVALNMGDEMATGFPRIYMDADVRLSKSALQFMVETLSDKYLATSPRIQMNFDGASWMVRSYYKIWLSLPYCQNGMIGAGVYALSEAGRSRFETFPNVLADDGYIRALFKEIERTATENCYSIVTAPKTLSGLIKIKTRSRIGGYELEKKFPHLIQNEDKDYTAVLYRWLWQIHNWPKIVIYIFVNYYAKIRAKKIKDTEDYLWERDDTSRLNPNSEDK
jgi:glycosyltransferase involved in cell wall biosynthesis